MTDVTYVPDGELCPKHGEPSRLLRGATGLFSQCAKCREGFLDWYGGHTRDVRPAPRIEFAESADSAEPSIPAWRARQILEAQKQPKPAQFGLDL